MIYFILISRASVHPDEVCQEELCNTLTPENKEYLQVRKRRRSTVGNIWQLRAVLEQEIDDDSEFVVNVKEIIREEEEEEEGEGNEEEEHNWETGTSHTNINGDDGLYTTHL